MSNIVHALHAAGRAVSFALLLKSMVGLSMVVLALFGVTMPLLGITPTPMEEAGAAAFGALLGALLALRA